MVSEKFIARNPVIGQPLIPASTLNEYVYWPI